LMFWPACNGCFRPVIIECCAGLGHDEGSGLEADRPG
jgi:hypothetical protein